MKNLAHKLHELNTKRGKLDLKQYVKTYAANDPNFLRWLFDQEPAKDTDFSLSDKQKKAFETMLAFLE